MWIAIPGQGVMEVNIKFGLRVPSNVAILGNVPEAYARRVVSVKPIPTSYRIYYHFLSATNCLIWFSNVHTTNNNLLCLDEAKEVTRLVWTLNLTLKPYQDSNPIRDTVMPRAYIEHEPSECWMFTKKRQSSCATLSNIHSWDSV